MFTKNLEITLNIAFTRAKNNQYEIMTVEHLLLALLDNPEVIEVLTACGAVVDGLRDELQVFIDETTPRIPVYEQEQREAQPTLGFQRVLQRAIFQAQAAGKTEVTGVNVLAAIFNEQESQAVFFLNQQNVSRLDVLNYLNHGVAKFSDSSEPSSDNFFESPMSSASQTIQETPNWDNQPLTTEQFD